MFHSPELLDLFWLFKTRTIIVLEFSPSPLKLSDVNAKNTLLLLLSHEDTQ